jgi:prepilin-type N-terminal cleavage/methylation domain-containing protein
MNRKGFTLIELILVIAILGILAVSALPKFLNLSASAQTAARDGVVGAVRSGIALARANNLSAGGDGSAPTSLESGTCCFGNVLTNPVNTGWTNSGNNYTFTALPNSNYTYNQTNGTFQ